jgi:DNA invertase Pin-like site-specific DNA recombinase
MLIILGGLAEFEHTLIRARTGEGRERAKARGVRFGGQSSLLMPRRPRRILLHTNGPGRAR